MVIPKHLRIIFTSVIQKTVFHACKMKIGLCNPLNTVWNQNITAWLEQNGDAATTQCKNIFYPPTEGGVGEGGTCLFSGSPLLRTKRLPWKDQHASSCAVDVDGWSSESFVVRPALGTARALLSLQLKRADGMHVINTTNHTHADRGDQILISDRLKRYVSQN